MFSSHYASDLIVFRKYDYGANVQCYYALKSYCALMRAVGEDCGETKALLLQMPADLAETMEAEGPFGRQITGGTSLGEDEDHFYIPEGLFYYGGEDTATVLAPLYGLYEFDYEPYVNLHRFARSMFISNYDPEFQTLRELHFGMNPSATGCTLRLGGSYTREEMLETLRLLYDRLDETGSLFWWPRVYNKKRCLTRCSQGQGAWLQQSVEQWYGLRMDGLEKRLSVRPQGLLSSYDLKKIRLGAFCFDLFYEEQEDRTSFAVTNHSQETICIDLYVRPFGAGAERTKRQESIRLAPGETVQRVYLQEKAEQEESFALPVLKGEQAIVQKECEAYGSVIFAPYGIVMPKLTGGDCGIFLLRFVIAHTEDTLWEDVRVELQLPGKWRAAEKKFYIWDYQPVFAEDEKAVCSIGSLQPDTHGVAGFYVSLPDRLAGDEKSVMLSEHPFSQNADGPVRKVCLYIEDSSESAQDTCSREDSRWTELTAILRVCGKIRASYTLPVQILPKKEYEKKFEEMYHGVRDDRK